MPKHETLDHQKYPFLMRTKITAIVINKAQVEEKVSYDATFPLTQKAVALPWYVLANHLAPAFLTKKLGPEGVGWKKIYERRIIKIVNRANPQDITDIPLRVMTTDQLKLYVKKWELGINVDEFHSVIVARRLVQLKLEDPTAYDKHLDEYRESRKAEYPEVDDYRKDAAMVAVDLAEEFDALANTDSSTPAEAVSDPLEDALSDMADVQELEERPAPKKPEPKKRQRRNKTADKAQEKVEADTNTSPFGGM